MPPESTDADRAADAVEAHDEADEHAIAYLMGLFAWEFMARLESGDFAAIEQTWSDLTFEAWEGPFMVEATTVALAVTAATGVAPDSITQDAVTAGALRHLAAFADYGRFLASVVAVELTTPRTTDPLLAVGIDRVLPGPVADALDRAGRIRAALAPHLTTKRLGILAERVKDHLRNAVTDVVFTGAPEPPGKQWWTRLDGKVRKAHQNAHGQRADSAGYFHIGGHPARYPGDTDLPIELWINCRCFTGPTGMDPDEFVTAVFHALARVAPTESGALGIDGATLNQGVDRADRLGPIDTTGLPGGTPAMAMDLNHAVDLLAEEHGRRSDDALRLHLTPDAAAALARSGQLVHAGPDHTGTGVMVCVRPLAEQAAALAVPDGCPVEDLHVTLGYFGSVEDHGPSDDAGDSPVHTDLQMAAAESAWGRSGLIAGELSGVAVFEANPERPMIGLVDAPGLGSLRALLVQLLGPSGGPELRTDHDFQPHLTLGFDPTPEELAAAIEQCTGAPVTFDALEVVYGAVSTRYPFGQEDGDDMRPAPTAAAEPIKPPTRPEPAGEDQAATEPAALDVGTDVSIDGTDLEGRIVEVLTEGTADGLEGIVEASEQNPVYMVQIVTSEDGQDEDTDTVVGIYADRLTPFDAAGDDAPEEDDEMGHPRPPAPTATQRTAPDGSTRFAKATPGRQVLDGLRRGVKGAPVAAVDQNRLKLLAAMAEEMDLPPDLVFREELFAQVPILEAGVGALNAGRSDYEHEGVLIEEGIETGDGRLALPGSLTWRNLPATLMCQFQNPETGGHALAIPSGSMWEMERVGNAIVERGFFDSGFGGTECRRMMDEGTLKGVSVDLDMVTSELWYDNPEMLGTPLLVFALARVMGATVTPFPAMMEAVLYLTDVQPEAAQAIVASGSPVWGCEGQFWTPRRDQPGRGLVGPEVERLTFQSLTGDTFVANAIAA